MRHLTTFAALLLIGSSVTDVLAASASSPMTQYGAAAQTFLGGDNDMQSYPAGFAKNLFNGIDGMWGRISAVGAGATQQEFDQFCAVGPLTKIATIDQYTLGFTTFAGRSNEFLTHYSLRGGSAFGAPTDIAAALHALGLDQGNAGYSIMARLNGSAGIWRPSSDIVVVQAEYDMPSNYGRCPPAK